MSHIINTARCYNIISIVVKMRSLLPHISFTYIINRVILGINYRLLSALIVIESDTPIYGIYNGMQHRFYNKYM